MKFYTENKSYINYRDKILVNKLTAIYSNKNSYIQFFKNGQYHNAKNATYTDDIGHKDFYLNDVYYGNQHYFKKKNHGVDFVNYILFYEIL